MQIDEESRNAIYDMCDAVAIHHDIPRFDAVIEQQEDGSSRVTYYGEGVGSRVDDTNFKPKLKLVVDNGQEDDTPSFDVATGGKFKKRDFTGFDYE